MQLDKQKGYVVYDPAGDEVGILTYHSTFDKWLVQSMHAHIGIVYSLWDNIWSWEIIGEF